MAATSSEGPTSREVPLSAMALQPSLQVPEVPGTFTLSMAICQYPRLVTGALHAQQSSQHMLNTWDDTCSAAVSTQGVSIQPIAGPYCSNLNKQVIIDSQGLQPLPPGLMAAMRAVVASVCAECAGGDI